MTGREIDGRVTLGDLGMPGMASRAKEHVGRALMEREGPLLRDIRNSYTKSEAIIRDAEGLN